MNGDTDKYLHGWTWLRTLVDASGCREKSSTLTHDTHELELDKVDIDNFDTDVQLISSYGLRAHLGQLTDLLVLFHSLGIKVQERIVKQHWNELSDNFDVCSRDFNLKVDLKIA